jgi:hypothetical protein
MGVISEEQLLQVWEEQGLEHRMKRFYKYLTERGLLPMSVPRDIFLDHMYDGVLKSFFVNGIKELPDGEQRQADSD